MMQPENLLRGVKLGTTLRVLEPLTLEKALASSRILTSDGSISARARERGVLVDLSTVEWVDFGTVVQLALLIDTFASEGLTVSVALPRLRARRIETQWIRAGGSRAEGTRERLRRRAAVRRFLYYLRFARALAPPHRRDQRRSITIIEDFDSSASPTLNARAIVAQALESALEEEDRIVRDFESTATRYRYHFPLTWLSPHDQKTITDVAGHLTNVIADPERGIEPFEAETISNVVLYELVDNVRSHAREGGGDAQPWALVAAWAKPADLQQNNADHPRRWKNYYSTEREYFGWLAQKPIPIVDIVVGDSGAGIPRVLAADYRREISAGRLVPRFTSETASTIAWAFDRWSTSKTRGSLRGTRGLYRVDRVATKAQGLVSVRSGDAHVSLDHGGLNVDRWLSHDDTLGCIPGTTVRLRLPAFRQHGYVPRAVPFDSPPLVLSVLRCTGISPDGLPQESIDRIVQAMAEVERECPSAVLVSMEDEDIPRDGLQPVLRQLAELRHPCGIAVLGLPGGWELIEGAVNSVNEEHRERRRYSESTAREQFTVWDPVLVLGSKGEATWVGASGYVADTLNALIARGGALSTDELSALIANEQDRRHVIETLRADRHVVQIDDLTNITLRLNPLAVCLGLGTNLRRHIQQGGTGVVRGAYRTPSLMLSSYWIDIANAVEACGGPYAAGYALAGLIRRHETDENLKGAFLVPDSTGQTSVVESLRRSLSVERVILGKEAHYSTAQAANRFPPDARVFVYADFVGSGESGRRVLTQVLRDGGIPAAVACLVDGREDVATPLEIWGRQVPVVSLARWPVAHPGSVRERDITYINPLSLEPEDMARPTTEGEEDHVYTLSKRHDALHFNHIGEQFGRHFTFYLDATRLFADKTITNAFAKAIVAWMSDRHGSKIPGRLEVWHPAPEPKPSEPARRIAEGLQSIMRWPIQIRSIRREPHQDTWVYPASQPGMSAPHVVIVDWGAISGTTVAQMARLAASAGARRVLVCVFLSQLRAEEEAFLKSLAGFRFPKSQEHLLGFDHDGDRTPLPARTVSLEVKFLGHFSIGTYRWFDCPVCEQVRRLSDEVLPTRFLIEFAKQQVRRLRIRSRDEVVAQTEPRDLHGLPLNGSKAVMMALHRRLLTEALTSTRKRKAVLDLVERIGRGVAGGSSDTKAEAYSLMLLLSLEYQWLKLPPLHFSVLRSRLADLALVIARDTRAEEHDRLSAIIVLRTASKVAFARSLGPLASTFGDSKNLWAQLLYDAATVFNRSYKQSLGLLGDIKTSLSETEALLAERASSADPFDDVVETVEMLSIRAETEWAKAHAASKTVPEVWADLQEELSTEAERTHHTVSYKMAKVKLTHERRFIERLVNAGPESSQAEVPERVLAAIRKLEENWVPCLRFLDSAVLPRLKRLQRIFDGEDCRNALGRDNAKRLNEFISSPLPLAESDFSRLIRAASLAPNLLFSRANWDQFKNGSDFFFDVVLRAGSQFAEAPLRAFVESCPTTLGEAFASAWADAEGDGIAPDIDRSERDACEVSTAIIFCPFELAKEAMFQVLHNIHKHRVPNAPMPQLKLAIEVGDDVSLVMANNGTQEVPDSRRPDRRSGKGLREIRGRLKSFDGRLITEQRPLDGWSTFVATLRFTRGV